MDRSQILVVEDDPLMRTALTDILELEGYEVRTAANGVEALAAAEHDRPSLVVLDLCLPLLDGCEFTQALRERSIDLPILVVSEVFGGERFAREMGADAYVEKPFEFPDFLDSVGRLCAGNGVH